MLKVRARAKEVLFLYSCRESNEMPTILIVEDEDHIAEGLKFNLEAEGFDVDVAETGEKGLELLQDQIFDALVLDVMLPGIDGFEVARRLRFEDKRIPILMLTARGRSEDVLDGFEAGADDYLAKPFELSIFLARLNGLLRRSGWGGKHARGYPEASDPALEKIAVNGRTIDFTNLEIGSGDTAQRLTLMEARLLRYLIENSGRPVSRKEILTELWELHEDTDTRAIDNFIVRLRKLIEQRPDDPKVLVTVRGIGYKFVATDANVRK